MDEAGQRLSLAERVERGKQARKASPRSHHADWAPAPQRRDPVDIVTAQDAERLAWLVPLRHSRMGASAFTFYRGSAAVMAQDLQGTPDSGLWTQIGGDAHLSNFGAYASPSRELVFDANDFDETLPGPWEWDVKRLAASLVIACQNSGLPDEEARLVAEHAVSAYRRSMADYAQRNVLDLWYDYLNVESLERFSGLGKREVRERIRRFQTKARSRTSLQALQKLATRESGSLRIASQPPTLVPLDELSFGPDPEAGRAAVEAAFDEYAQTTGDHIRLLLSRFRMVDVAIKVVGVGSVGTRCWIILLEGRDDQDPLFLQVKEAGPSVLEEHLPASRYNHHGQRVVAGQRLIQAQTDIFLGWTTGREGLHYYVRQLRDWKGSANVDTGTPRQFRFYADLCARTMARGHARSGDPVAISAYLGSSAKFDGAIAQFAMRYAEQNLADYRRFRQAVADGLLPVAEEGLA